MNKEKDYYQRNKMGWLEVGSSHQKNAYGSFSLQEDEPTSNKEIDGFPTSLEQNWFIGDNQYELHDTIDITL